jgi:DNA-binding GntR family transcriptional regulator
VGCESHDHDELIDCLEAGNAEQAADFMSKHLRAIESSLAIVEEEAEAPDLRHIFSS